jgi:hypothetical protein
LTRQNREGDVLQAYVRSTAAGQAQVALNVDDYPRAFIYEFPLDATLQDVERKQDLREIGLPDEKAFPVYLAGKVTEPVRFPFSVDMLRAGDGSSRVRVFIAAAPTADFDLGTLMFESFDDRAHKVELVKVEEAPALALFARTSDLQAMLDLSAYENQPLYVRVQILGQREGEEVVLEDKPLKLYLDGRPPTIEAFGPGVDVYEKTPFTIRLDPRDDISGIKHIEFALDKQPNPDPKATDKEVLAKPDSKGIRTSGGVYQLTHEFEKPGTQWLYFQATDMRGNKSKIEELEITVQPTPVVAGNKGPAVPVAKLGQIVGRAGLPAGMRGDVKTVILKDAGGKVVREIPNSGGNFVFDKVPPGEYTVEAKGFIGGVDSKPAPVPVTVEAGKRAGPIEVLLSR